MILPGILFLAWFHQLRQILLGRHLYGRGCATLVQSGGRAPVLAAGGEGEGGWTHLALAALGHPLGCCIHANNKVVGRIMPFSASNA